MNHAEMWLRFGEGIGVERTSVRSAALYDRGNALFRQQKYPEAAEAFRYIELA